MSLWPLCMVWNNTALPFTRHWYMDDGWEEEEEEEGEEVVGYSSRTKNVEFLLYFNITE